MKIVIGLERMIENMPYVKNKNGLEIGDWTTTTRKIDSCAGYFENIYFI